mmetsp:Transcript_13488/g.20494  ORF Transcript_13488/g.20494 Transcript_13488/m.20494 type:complete len:124 (+) Transcript_13488:51-422(+)
MPSKGLSSEQLGKREMIPDPRDATSGDSLLCMSTNNPRTGREGSGPTNFGGDRPMKMRTADIIVDVFVACRGLCRRNVLPSRRKVKVMAPMIKPSSRQIHDVRLSPFKKGPPGLQRSLARLLE